MQRRGTLLIIVGIILAIGTAAIAFIILQSRGEQPPVPPEPTPEAKTAVVIAAQEIPAYTDIPQDAVDTWEIPQSALSKDHLLDPEAVVGKQAMETIVDPARAREMGYDASLNIPEGEVAMAFKTTHLAAVAGAVQSGDFVDLLISYWFIDTEQELGVAPEEEEEQKESYILLAQLLLQDVEVLRVGPWAGAPPPEEEVAEEAEGEAQEEEQPEEEEEQPTVAPEAETILTLLLNQQDALVVKFARESGATIDLVLRGREDHDTVRTETVSIEYIMTRFEITVPPEPLRFIPRKYRE
jgi:Flp pilus assembly protein CpaB